LFLLWYRLPIRRDPDARVDCETAFAEDLLGQGVAGLSLKDMRAYLESVADQRLQSFGIKKRYGTRNPFSFMELQDVQELANFFERKVSAYQIAVGGFRCAARGVLG
jgi:ribonucleoside-diphosphate reductase beta chain